MGEYFSWVNVDKKEYIQPGDFDLGQKAVSQHLRIIFSLELYTNFFQQIGRGVTLYSLEMNVMHLIIIKTMLLIQL